MDEFLVSACVQVLNGFQLGFLYFMFAIGLSLILGVMGVVNLAHGSFYMLGAYLFYAGLQARIPPILSVLAALAAIVALSMASEKTIFRSLRDRSHLDQVLLTYGLILIANEVITMVWGPTIRSIDIPDALSGSVSIGFDREYPLYRLLVSVVGIVVGISVWLLLSFTRIGIQVRAGVFDREMTSALGVDVNLVSLLVFGFGIVLAAFAGIVAAPILSLYPGMGETILIPAIMVVILGGLGSLKGAFVASILVGMVETIGRVTLPELSNVVIYLVVAAILYLRPEGLFGARISK
ncbi:MULTISPECIES: branched-chain amino acid ABC transporter permease [Alphaproteobacteria]|jgi:branched-chain amino acid transport system permease protein|uniref:branched-chain amino acid ABC transporter permease n=1 Tax=Alphaproteobacteria TaxID=28211 RepID=UPI000C4D187A|nr:branched-chain amino acid ABC transporter permease [Hyphomonas sp. UBA3201]MAL76321.1 branched-chain amino acid ABC transporter permease [Rhodospirillaceae bacterium]MAO91710.1 branched-chain amino acid ABC transporter permease [Rhodospirillales bacterium]MAX64872.1 branched-chain amino acid ABC transporter permease [Rhodospirillaceae bacterium]MBB57105.1 branched-chain amino acid ABC transporter permease [Rhodospirillaceae bacterium]|tara:strand:- start:36466 stop:37347 length:882 start_codon:yes stop_codon:yes gene_type:complete